MPELTDRLLRNTKWPETGRIEISDTKRRGLRFRLSSTGRAVWFYERRVKGGGRVKATLGTWPAVSLAEARAEALVIEAETARGINRVEVDREARRAAELAGGKRLTVQDLINRYHVLHLSTLRTGDERKRQLIHALDCHLDAPASSLTRRELQAAVDAKVQANRPVMANRIAAALRAFTHWAFKRGYIDSNVGEGVSKAVRETALERAPTVADVRRIWMAAGGMPPLWGSFLRLLILTAQRRGDILGLSWDEIDIERRRIELSGARTKNGKPHITHLSAPALDVLRALRERAEADRPFVFTTTGRTPMSGVSKMKRRLDELLGDDFEPWRLHDLRTAFATAMAEVGQPENVVDRVLNHVASGSAPSAVARVYNRADQLPQRAAVLDQWAEMVTGERGGVVELHTRFNASPSTADLTERFRHD